MLMFQLLHHGRFGKHTASSNLIMIEAASSKSILTASSFTQQAATE